MPRAGVILPSFVTDPDVTFAAAEIAVAAGVDGLFCYDHLWPMGHPERPALSAFATLSALSRRFPYVTVGPLVARVALFPDALFVRDLLTLATVANGRVIGALGVGDNKSAQENFGYGVGATPIGERRRRLLAVGETLKSEGVRVWVGGNGEEAAKLARAIDVTLNMWGVDAATLKSRAQTNSVTWAGLAPNDPHELIGDTASYIEVGAQWVIYGWPVTIDSLVTTVRHMSA